MLGISTADILTYHGRKCSTVTSYFLNGSGSVNSFIHSIDISENPYIKSFKPGTKPSNNEMDPGHKIFDLEQKKKKTLENVKKVQAVYIIFKGVKEIPIPLTTANMFPMTSYLMTVVPLLQYSVYFGNNSVLILCSLWWVYAYLHSVVFNKPESKH